MLQLHLSDRQLVGTADQSCWTRTEGLAFVSYAGIILYMCPANGRWRHIATSSLIGWAHTQNDPCNNQACTFSAEKLKQLFGPQLLHFQSFHNCTTVPIHGWFRFLKGNPLICLNNIHGMHCHAKWTKVEEVKLRLHWFQALLNSSLLSDDVFFSKLSHHWFR